MNEQEANNPIGCLQERMQKAGKPTPEYVAKHELGRTNVGKQFVTEVRLHGGLKATGTGITKKLAKQNAAKVMLDVLDGRAKAINDDVLESIDVGLKALRGGEGSSTANKSSPVKVKEEKKPEKKPAVEVKRANVYPYNSFTPCPPKPDPPVRRVSLEQNRGLNDEGDVNVGKVKKEVQKTTQEWMKDLLLEIVNDEITKIESSKNPKPEQICKLCNLVFVDENACKKHKKGENHAAVHKGEFPGKGGYHCFLCWVNFLQPESLLNHLARPNHHDKAKKNGVLKVWMEPQPIVPTWDTIRMMGDLRDLQQEENRSFRGARRRSRSKGDRDQSPQQRKKVRGRSPDEAIKAGVTGDWRKAREKTTKELERIKERERREREEKERIARKRREERDRERREWERRERERREEQRRRWEEEERYWRQREEAEWRDWERRRREEEERWEREWRLQEEREWMDKKAKEWREREREKEEQEKLREKKAKDKKKDSRKSKKRHKQDLEDGECDSEEEVQIKPRKHKKSDKPDKRSSIRDERMMIDDHKLKRKLQQHDAIRQRLTEMASSSSSSRHDSSSRQQLASKSSRQHEGKQRISSSSRHDEKLSSSSRHEGKRSGSSRHDSKISNKGQSRIGDRSRRDFGGGDRDRISKKSSSGNIKSRDGKRSSKEADLREILKKKRALQRVKEEMERSSEDSDSSDEDSDDSDEEDSSSESSSSSEEEERRKKKYDRHRKGGSGKGGSSSSRKKTNLLVEMKGAILGVLDKEISSLARK
eukprot:TRINITY_DN4199_c0_g1_i5.p1 TRINITY_DN4199_c0_g1~~TRINITY_DN4199_c0_g1_i5.p1  ORF type:complete len:767 (-),score=273.61 TRINITY_DN4199_c0_g1_i5:236-2536(-)